ncbi:MAG TPA: GNAT family N-acetyltransferase [Stellaceae bacterium]
MNKPITLDNLDERVTFRFADADDVPDVLALYIRFYDEAVYKDFLEFDPARARDTILNGIVADTRPHIIAEVDQEIVGFLAYILDHTFSVRPCQVLMEFYVAPEFRRSAIGRALLAMAIQEGKAADAGAFHAPVASGMREARSLFNMFDKAGFKQFGFMTRRGY